MSYTPSLLLSFMGAYGALLLFYRLVWQRYALYTYTRETNSHDDDVSIIVPCRNEENNINTLLTTINAQSYDAIETIVVDDNSSDNTGKLAEAAGARLLTLSSKEEGWKGKPWACWQGSKISHGDYLLFTDADTTIDKTAISRSISYMKSRQLDLMSALPYHQNEDFWEKLLGVFHLFIIVVTKPYAKKIDPKQLYGIGQYLLFKKDAYEKINGHSSVKKLLVDDLTLINVLVSKGLNYGVYPAEPLYRVRMYDNFRDFIQGWKRHMRGGVRTLNFVMIIEMFALYSLFMNSSSLENPYLDIPALIVAIPTIIYGQKLIGNFSSWSVLFAPFSLLLFSIINLMALFDTLLQRDYTWKGRSYSPDTLV